MERMEQLEKIAAESMGKQFEESTKLVQKYCKVHEVEIMRDFSGKMQEGFAACQDMGKKVYYIVLSVLESSSLTRSYEIQIAFYNEKMYLEDAPIYAYWAPVFLFSQIEQDMKFYKKIASQKLIRIKEYEIDAIRKQYILNHYFQAMLLLIQMIPSVLKEEETSGCLAEEVMVFFGRFMEKPLLIYQMGGVEM